MISCGFDLSTSCSGYSVFDGDALIEYGAIKPHGADWREKVIDETLQISAIFKKYTPDYVYAEDVPLKPGANTLLKLGAVQGMFLSLCAGFKLNPIFLLPSAWRHEIGLYDGTRGGMKRDVLKERAVMMANRIFGLELKWCGAGSKRSEDDIAEGILIAYSQIVKNKNV